MSRVSEPTMQPSPDKSTCLARSVVDALSKEPSLEAITINRTQQKISVATLGKTDEPRVSEAVTGRIQKSVRTGRHGDIAPCSKARAICHSCGAPLSESERQKITIQHQGDVTTIARVTCPTAPKFWRWR